MRKFRFLPKMSVDPYLMTASIMANFFSLALPILMLQIYDRIIPRQGVESLAVLALGATIAIIAEMVVRSARARLMALAGDAFERDVQVRLFERLLKADLKAVEKETPGAYVDRIASVDRLREFRHGEAAMVILDLPFTVLFLLTTAIISYQLAIVVLLIVGLSIIANRVTREGLPELSAQKKLLDSRRFSFLLEVLGGIEMIKSFNLEGFMERRYERLMGSSAAIAAESTARSNFAQSVTGSVGQVTPFIIASVGSILAINQSISIGALAAVILLGTRIVQPIMKFEAMRSVDEDVIRVEREIAKVLTTPFRVEGETICEAIERIELSDITLKQEGSDAPLFNKLNLTLQRGEIITLEGNVGCGRSTLLWLIMGFVTPDAGEVRINGNAITDYRLASVRDRIAYLPPAPKMLEGNVLENMTRFDPEKFLPEAIQISAQLGLASYFAHHQDGLMTKVGHGLESGLPTSVTERIPLVGALVGNPDIVLFDEANANLDMDGDNKLKDYLASLRGKVSVILVTQRPSYFALADRRYRIENGVLNLVENKPAAASPERAAAS